MNSKCDSFYKSAKIIRTELDHFTKNVKHPLDWLKFQKFLYESINFLSVNSVSNGESQQTAELQDWFTLLSQVLHLLFQHQDDFDQKSLSLYNIISYLVHMGFHLVKIKEIPLAWHQFLGFAMLEFLALYSKLPTAESEFIVDVAHKFYAFLRVAGQNVEKDINAGKEGNISLCYELYLLGSAILSLDTKNKSRDGLKTAKDLLATFSQSASANSEKPNSVRGKEALASLLRMVDVAIIGFTLQPRHISGDASLSFYVELFRFVAEEASLREKLLACEGNLFKCELGSSMFQFPREGTWKLREANMQACALDHQENKVQGIVLAVLNLVNTLDCAISGQQQTETVQGTSKPSSSKPPTGPSLLENLEEKITEVMEPTIANIQTLLLETPKPLSTPIGDCLAALVHAVPSAKLLTRKTLLACYKLVSLSTEVLARDIMYNASKENQLNFVFARVYTLAVANKTRLAILQVILSRDDIENIGQLAVMLKSSLTALCVLAQTVKKKQLLSPSSNSFKQIFKSLSNAISSVGSLGRHLRRMELYNVAISLLAPLWPVANMEELLPHVSHHETLVESYRQTSQPEKACQVIAEAVKLETSLLSEPLIKTLVKIVKEDARLSILKLFDACKEDEMKHARILAKVVQSLLSASQSSSAQKNAVNILQSLRNNSSLSDSEKAVYTFMLAENCWFDDSLDENLKKSISEPENLVRKAVDVLINNSSCQFDDYLAQATFLYWEILNRALCLDKVSSEGDQASASADTSDSDLVVPALSSPSKTRESVNPSTATPPTPLKRAVSLKAAVPASSRLAQPEDQCGGNSGTSLQMDSDWLMKKSGVCLAVWTNWFKKFGHAIVQEADSAFRAEKSLGFLQRVADLAILNHQTIIAIKALCQAHNLAERVKREDVIKRVTSVIVSLVPQLGLQWDVSRHNGDSKPDDVFMEALNLGQEGHVLHLAAVAGHHLKSGQLIKFAQVYSVASKLIDKAREKGPLTPNVSIALAILKRLKAEFCTLSRKTEEDFMEVDKVGPYSIGLAEESLKYITSVAAFYLGEEYKSVENRGSSVVNWRVIHEYLCTLKLVGELFLHTGNVKYARTYFNEGWMMARSCLLKTWSAIFLSKLVNVSLYYYDSTKEAEEQIKRTMHLIQKQVLTPQELECHGLDVNTFLNLASQKKTFLCSLHSSSGETQLSSLSCNCEGINNGDVRRQLLTTDNTSPVKTNSATRHNPCVPEEKEDLEREVQAVCYADLCERCFEPSIANVSTSLMWYQAEILSRNQGSAIEVTKLLSAAACTAQRLSKISYESCLGDILHDCGLRASFVPQDINTSTAPVLETLFRLAECYFQKLYSQDVDSGGQSNPVTSREVKSLLQAVVTEGKKLKGFASSDVLVAGAQLLILHLSHIPILRAAVEEERGGGGKGEVSADGLDREQAAVDEAAAVMASTINVVRKEQEYWQSPLCNLKSSQTANKSNSICMAPLKDNKLGSNSNAVDAKKFIVSNLPSTKYTKKTKARTIAIFQDFESTPVTKTNRKPMLKRDIYDIETIGQSPYLTSSLSKNTPASVRALGKKSVGTASSLKHSIKGSESGKADSKRKTDVEGQVSPLTKHMRELDLNSSINEPTSNTTCDILGQSGKKPAKTKSSRNRKVSSLSLSCGSQKQTDLPSSPAIYLQKHRELMERLSAKKTKPSRSRLDPKIGGDVGQEKAEKRMQPEHSGMNEHTSRKIKEDSSEREIVNSSMEISLNTLNGDDDDDDHTDVMEVRAENKASHSIPKLKGRQVVNKITKNKQNGNECVNLPMTCTRQRRTRKAKALIVESPENRRGNSLLESPEPRLGDFSLDEIVVSPEIDSLHSETCKCHDYQSCQDRCHLKSGRCKITYESPLSPLTLCKMQMKSKKQLHSILAEIDLNVDSELRPESGKIINITSPVELPRGRPQRKTRESKTKEVEEAEKIVTIARRKGKNSSSARNKSDQSALKVQSFIANIEFDDRKENVTDVNEGGDVKTGYTTPEHLNLDLPTARRSRLALKKNRNKPLVALSSNVDNAESEDEGKNESKPLYSLPSNIKAESLLGTEDVGKIENTFSKRQHRNLNSRSGTTNEEDKSPSLPSKQNCNLKRAPRNDLSGPGASTEKKTKKNGLNSTGSESEDSVSSSGQSPPSPLESLREKMSSMELEDIENDSLLVEVEKSGAPQPMESQRKAEALIPCKSDISMSDGEGDSISGVQAEADKAEGMKSLRMKFPTLNALLTADSTRLQGLEDSLTSLQGFPNSFLHRQLSRSIAFVLWQTELTADMEGCQTDSSTQDKIAAYLTDSMHVTFRHLMMKNLHAKLKKSKDGTAFKLNDSSEKTSSHHQPSENACDWTSLSGEELRQEREALTTALKALAFGGGVVDRFWDRLKLLPADWTVVQMTVVDFDPMNPGWGQLLITRLTSELQPVTIGVPYKKWQHFARALKVYETAVKHNVENVSPEQYWKYRYRRDKDMQNLIHYLQEIFLSGHKWLFKGQADCVRQQTVKKLLDRAARRAVESVQQQHQHKPNLGTVRVLLEVLLSAHEKDVSSVLECVWPLHVAHTLARFCVGVQKEVLEACGGKWEEKRGPVVLILDKALNKIPWESMPDLFMDTITRVPSLAALQALLILHSRKASSPFLKGVNRDSTVAVVDPETNLQNSTDFLVPQFKQYKGWKCLSQKAPTVTDLKSFLTDHSMYLYCGHGWGKQFVGGNDLQMFRGKAVAIIMGCHSGKLDFKAKVEGDGGPLYYLLAGCPAVMGNLWLVTDKDIDKLTSSLVSQWMAQSKSVPLGHLLASARKVCKLVGLNGFAPVIYGLPVVMNA